MKKKLLLFLTTIITVLGIAAFAVACDNSAEKADYTVTVLMPDEETPKSGVTVNWAGSGANESAVTGSDGKATANLPLGTYSVTLSGYGEEYDYTPASVTANMRKITYTLSERQVNYTATVTDKTGAPAVGVTVTWTNGTAIAGTATTNAQGVAEKQLSYGNYTVTLANLPAGNVFSGSLSATGASPTVSARLEDGEANAYSVTVKTEGGLIFKEQTVIAYKGEQVVASGSTDDKGVFTFSAKPDDYTVKATSLPDGYTSLNASLTADVREGELLLHSEVIMDEPASGTTYVMGDIIHNYSFQTPYNVNGQPLSCTIAKILETKKAVLINNWGINCSWCVKEMPSMQEAYEKYKDKIELIAVNNYQGGDSANAITGHYQSYGYTFPMVRDTYGFANKFGLQAWPTTIVIDRYGAVARIESGAILDAEVWGRLIEKYIGDDYVQDFERGTHESESITTEMAKPDVVLDEDHYEKVALAMNVTSTFPAGAYINWYGETEYEMAWPFILGKVDGVSEGEEQVMYSSNTGKANSMSIIYAKVKTDADKVFTFDYYSDTEESDVVSILWDGKIIKEISGNSGGWKTCYLYSDVTLDEHEMAMTYIKDSSQNVGKDNVYIKNVRFADITDVTESTDMLRGAAFGTPEENAKTYPYYVETELKADGYYHVDIAKTVQGGGAKGDLGNDQSPLLFANLLSATSWLPQSVNDLVHLIDENTDDYKYDCTFDIGYGEKDYREDIVRYLTTANASDIHGFVPVDETLAKLLRAFTAVVNGAENTHEKKWLEVCYYYSHYGDGQPVGNPIMGLTEKTAYVATLGNNTASLTRNMIPFPSAIYTFTPDESAVYKFESLIPDADAGTYVAQIWLYDDETIKDKSLAYSGDNRFVRDGANEQNFELYYYMTAGHKYYFSVAFLMSESGQLNFRIEKAGQSVTRLESCTDHVYSYELDGQGNPDYTKLKLQTNVEVVLHTDGYYHVKNKDGSVGDFVYFDIKYPTGLTNYSITALVDQKLRDPLTPSKQLDYMMFDFRFAITYTNVTEEVDGETVSYTTYEPKTSLVLNDPKKFKDYTDIMKTYIASAETVNGEAGLVKVDQQLVDILELFLRIRVNPITENKIEKALANEWLRFCWYFRTYDSTNV